MGIAGIGSSGGGRALLGRCGVGRKTPRQTQTSLWQARHGWQGQRAGAGALAVGLAPLGPPNGGWCPSRGHLLRGAVQGAPHPPQLPQHCHRPSMGCLGWEPSSPFAVFVHVGEQN